MSNHLHRARDAIVAQEPHKRQHQTYAAYRLAVNCWLLELKTIDHLIQLAKTKL
jgi:hypothetical protein